MADPSRRPWYQFSMRGLALLTMGLCIGLACGLAYSPFRKMAPNEAHTFKTPRYVVEPPDVLAVEIVSPGVPAMNLSDEYLIGPDGTLTVGQLQPLYVAGKTILEAQNELLQAARKLDRDAEVHASVAKYNSKRFYLLTRKNGADNICAMPFTGDEYVLDALAQLSPNFDLSSSNIWVSRPVLGANTTSHETLQVNYEAITERADPLSNYQLLPGDRLFVEAKPME